MSGPAIMPIDKFLTTRYRKKVCAKNEWNPLGRPHETRLMPVSASIQGRGRRQDGSINKLINS